MEATHAICLGAPFAVCQFTEQLCPEPRLVVTAGHLGLAREIVARKPLADVFGDIQRVDRRRRFGPGGEGKHGEEDERDGFHKIC